LWTTIEVWMRDAAGMAVAHVGHGDARGQVQVAPAFDVHEPRALAPFGDDVEVAVQDAGE